MNVKLDIKMETKKFKNLQYPKIGIFKPNSKTEMFIAMFNKKNEAIILFSKNEEIDVGEVYSFLRTEDFETFYGEVKLSNEI